MKISKLWNKRLSDSINNLPNQWIENIFMANTQEEDLLEEELNLE